MQTFPELALYNPTILAHKVTPWASITFSGTRHELELEFTGDNIALGEDLIDDIETLGFEIPDHIVADASINKIDHGFGPNERLAVTLVLLLLKE